MKKTYTKSKTIIRVSRRNDFYWGKGVLIGFGILMLLMVSVAVKYTTQLEKLPPIGIIAWIQIFILLTFLMFTALLFQGFEIIKIE